MCVIGADSELGRIVSGAILIDFFYDAMRHDFSAGRSLTLAPAKTVGSWSVFSSAALVAGCALRFLRLMKGKILSSAKIHLKS